MAGLRGLPARDVPSAFDFAWPGLRPGRGDADARDADGGANDPAVAATTGSLTGKTSTGSPFDFTYPTWPVWRWLE